MGKFKSLIKWWFTWLVQEQRRVVGRFQCGDLGVEEKIFSGKEWVCRCHVGGCHWLSNMTSVLGPTSFFFLIEFWDPLRVVVCGILTLLNISRAKHNRTLGIED